MAVEIGRQTCLSMVASKIDRSVYFSLRGDDRRWTFLSVSATSAAKAISSSKRDQLLATAWRLFYRDGYRAVGIDTLLAEAEVAKMTLYNHFASKEELIVAV